MVLPITDWVNNDDWWAEAMRAITCVIIMRPGWYNLSWLAQIPRSYTNEHLSTWGDPIALICKFVVGLRLPNKYLWAFRSPPESARCGVSGINFKESSKRCPMGRTTRRLHWRWRCRWWWWGCWWWWWWWYWWLISSSSYGWSYPLYPFAYIVRIPCGVGWGFGAITWRQAGRQILYVRVCPPWDIIPLGRPFVLSNEFE